ncbi:cupin domain-containing protein [uncultured Roseibium sp.]|uniref:cupin domain-containing protein n=1 Tax=uncultured Roseibium sp. TaxID=1936171 RepID=UPI002633E5AC|nr:cupin domain-containing protein [uncultured Roseibium sp.]
MWIAKFLGTAAVSTVGFLNVLQAGATDIRLATQSDLSWEVTPEGVAFAALKGKRFEESYMAMVRLPAGLVSPVHVKSAGMYGIVVEGEMVHLPDQVVVGEETVLKAGDFYEIPAGLAHLSKCVSKSDCVTFLYQDGAFDFLPVGEEGQ